MIEKIKEWSGVVALIAILLTWLIPAPTGNFGSSANGGNVTDYDAVNVIDGYYVDETQVINGSGVIIGTVNSTASTASFNSIGYQFSRSASLNSASTTVCTITSPAATSTVESASLLLTVSTTTAYTVTIGTANFITGTTTLWGTKAYAAGAQSTTFATSTDANLINTALAPSSSLNFTMSGGAGTFSPTGVCSAVFREID